MLKAVKIRLKKIKWKEDRKKAEWILGRVVTLLTVMFSAVSAYYAYQAVQVAINPVTTIELGRGNFTSASPVFYPQSYTTGEFRIAVYRYVIVYPYFVVDTRYGIELYHFGPVHTDVIVDGVTKGTIFYPEINYDTETGSLMTVYPTNITTVTGLGLVTRTYCVGICELPNAEVFLRADLVR